VPPAQVHVVHPGASARAADPARTAAAAERRVAGPRRKLLFVGKDFASKAGDQVVAALELLRKEVDPEITLTVVGPAAWPLPGGVPDGVDFRGRLPVAELSRVYDEHDLFVLPSRFEGFGIVFAEALGHGLPAVGRRAFAMPEIITPGTNGGLVDSDDAAELADLVAGLLADDALFAATGAAAPDVVAYYSWGRAADDVLRAVRGS
jgi:glycosyltransferase involved in cell wall biosynthesis